MNSSYTFKLPFVTKNHAIAIQEWKGMELSGAYAVAMSNKREGLKGHNITDNVITDEVLDRIGKDLAAVTGLNFAISFEKNTEKWQ
jgi:predicted RNA polymerase sigma factor